MTPPFADRMAVRLYRLLLHMYPAKFRADFGADMVQHFGDRVREAGLIRACAETSIDLARSLRREWMSALRGDPRFTRRSRPQRPERLTERLARYL